MFKSTIIGNLTRDAEIKQIGSKNAVVFTVAASNSYKKRSEQNPDDTNFVRCVRYATNPEALAPALTKGSKVYVCGGMKASLYTDKNGDKRLDLTCWVDDLDFFSSRNVQQGAAVEAAPAPAAESLEPQKDDLPF